MNGYHKAIVQFTWAVSGILVLAIFLLGLFFYVEQSTTGKDVLVQEGFCGVQDSPETTAGKEIFNSNCAACHKLDAYILGPGLRDADHSVLKLWLQDLPLSEDQVEYGRAFHHKTFNSRLTAEDIQAIYQYVNPLK